MDKNYLIQLTNKLYQLTLLFPKKEPLRYKMRELANEILAGLSRSQQSKHYREVVPIIETLDGFFEVAKAQNWVKKEKILNLQQEYSKMKEEIEREDIKTLKHKNIKTKEYSNSELEYSKAEINERQEKIIQFLKEKTRAQVKDLKEILPDITKRTLRRDFKVLLKQGIVQRIGQRNKTYYRLKSTS